METEYLPIPSLPNGMAGSDGSIWRNGIKLTPRRSPGSYFYVVQDRKTRLVHHLVLEAFKGPRPAGMVARHLNDRKTDNRAQNLQWGTQLENARDAIRNGRVRRGQQKPWAVLNEESVKRIRELSTEGWTNRQIADELGVSVEVVYSVVTRRTWRHVA